MGSSTGSWRLDEWSKGASCRGHSLELHGRWQEGAEKFYTSSCGVQDEDMLF